MPDTVVVASNNPVKARCVRRGFARAFPGRGFDFETVAVPSGVADQPRSDAETLLGARARAQNAAAARPEAAFWVGVEGGVAELDGELVAFAWVVIAGRDGSGESDRSGDGLRWGRSRTATFPLPEAVAKLVRAGKELGEADDIVFGRVDSKKHDGAVGLLTGGAIDRTALYEPSVVLALIPFRNGR